MPTVDEAFAKFKTKISVPTDKESKDASRRQKEIRGVMDREFHVKRDFLSGSYARWTKTKPLKDVDIFCVLGGEDHKYRDDDPSVILDKVAEIMSDEYGKENVTIQTRSVGIAFKNAAEEEVMSFDVVTAFDADIRAVSRGQCVKTIKCPASRRSALRRAATPEGRAHLQMMRELRRKNRLQRQQLSTQTKGKT